MARSGIPSVQRNGKRWQVYFFWDDEWKHLHFRLFKYWNHAIEHALKLKRDYEAQREHEEWVKQQKAWKASLPLTSASAPRTFREWELHEKTKGLQERLVRRSLRAGRD